MRKSLLMIFVLSAASFAITVAQTDWSGSGGVPGPVTDWGSNYFTSSVSTTITEVLRLASGILPTPTEHIVGDNFHGAASVYATDIDGDGDTDILGAAINADDITWWENTDGSGTAWTNHIIDGSFDGACSVYATDVDGDGDTDVLGTARDADEITWWENTYGTGTAWTNHIIDGGVDGARSVYATDIGDNGNTDVLVATRYDDAITWWGVNGYMDGTLESSILDAGLVDTWEMFSSSSTEPTGTSVAFQYRSSPDPSNMGAWSDTVFSGATPLSGILADSTHYLQYKVILETDDPLITPQLEDVQFSYTTYLSIGENGIISWELLQSENPAYGHLSVQIKVPDPGLVDLRVYDVTGRVIAGTSRVFSTGTHSVSFNDLAEGVYFCTMHAGDFTATERVVVLK